MNALLDLVYSLGFGFTLGVLMGCPRPRQIDEVHWHAWVALATALWPPAWVSKMSGRVDEPSLDRMVAWLRMIERNRESLNQ